MHVGLAMAVELDRAEYIKRYRRATWVGFAAGGLLMMLLLLGSVTWLREPPGCIFAVVVLACPIAGPFAMTELVRRWYRCTCESCGRRLRLEFERWGEDAGWYKLICPECGCVHRQSK